MRLIAAFAAAGIVTLAVIFALVSDSGDQNIPDEPVETSVDEIVDVPPKFLREPVRVSGSAVPIDRQRFVLRGARELIVVRAEPGAISGEVRAGERVTVTGIVENFDRLQIADLREVIRRGRHPALAAAPTELDDPFVSADHVEA